MPLQLFAMHDRFNKYDGDKSSCCNVVATDAIDIAELAYTEFTCYTFVADEVMLGEAVLRHSDHRSRINSVILRRGTSVQAECRTNLLVLLRRRLEVSDATWHRDCHSPPMCDYLSTVYMFVYSYFF